MPPCYCQWAKCDGKVVSKRLFDDHQRQDKRARANAALEAANQAIEEQDASIALYIAALTLSDETTGPSNCPGGRLWSRDTAQSSQATEHSPPTPHLPVTEALHKICDVEKRLVPLAAAVDLVLQTIGKPTTPVDAFPLRSFLHDASSLQNQLNSIGVCKSSVQEAKRPVAEGLAALLSQLRQANSSWAQELKLLSRAQDRTQEFDTGYHFSTILKDVDPIIQASIFTMVAFQVVIHASRRGCHFLLTMLRYIIQLTLMRKNSSLSTSDTKLLSDFPVDPDSAAQKLHLNGHETIRVVCPNSKCHKTYAPTFQGHSSIPNYPSYCTHRQFASGPECGTRLTRPRAFGDTDVELPIKRFVSFSFKNFVANLTSRLGFEDMMDAPSSSKDSIMRDVFDGNFLHHEFKGHDGAPFRSSSQDARYVFSLCVDFFNPFTNKQAGKKASIGIISIVCLSLPASLRYKPENMFLVGIIPGPSEPPLMAINHYLTPIIDEFEQFWDPGVHFSKTFNHPEGRLVFCALILVVCDLLAARKTAGFAACTHEHFCSICHCTRSREGYGNTDYESWKRRTDEDCREAAENYLNAETSDARIDEFNKSGVRWSELLRLSYFDISRCVIVDSMHNLFLGLIKEHFIGILGIALPTQKEKAIKVAFGPLPANMSDNDTKGVEKLQAWLEAPASTTFPTSEQGLKKLASVNMNSLGFVCQELGCSPTSKTRYYKKDYAIELLNWRLKQVEEHTGADTATKHGSVLDETEMAQIRSDLETILTPSWLTSVPKNLGSAAHGKLKADQWRALGTVHLPISLTHLWSRHMNHSPKVPRASRCHAILLVTMALVSAVILATSRTITPENAVAYRDYMLSYLEGIKFLFPEYKLRPNHHMSVHIYNYLLLFGPVHSWWTFPFERMIGAVQRMSHNSKIGELEETIARAYTRSANLRAVVTKSGCPEVIRHSEAIFRRFVDPQMQDSLQTDIQAFTLLLNENDTTHESEIIEAPHTFSGELQQAFKASKIKAPTHGQLLSNLSLGGLIYSTSSKHRGNSCVLFIRSEDMEELPAQIAYIVQFTAAGTTETYLGVRRHKPAKSIHDPLFWFSVQLYGMLSLVVWRS